MRTSITHTLVFSGSLLLSLNLFAQADNATKVKSSSLWNMIEQGGWAMVPLGICSLALIYLIIHSLRETKPSRFGTEFFGARMQSLCESGKLEEALAAAKQEPTLLGKALAAALPKLTEEKRESDREKVEDTIQEHFELEEHSIGQWIHYINVIATVSPMIGLLGTVSGMIGAFQTMSAGGMGRPELLAGDIGEALITTATGLCIGIPAMVAHSYFNNRLNNQLVENTQRANAISESLLSPSN
jgi:biopolymer transport protein ExbB